MEFNQKMHDVKREYFYWNVFEGLNDRNTITLATINISNDKNDDVGFEGILKGVKARKDKDSKLYIYGTVIIDDKK